MANHRRPSLRWPWKTRARNERAISQHSEHSERSARTSTLARRVGATLRGLATTLVGHDHAHHTSHTGLARSRVGVLAALGTGALMALVLAAELVIYRATSSLALLADAVHNLGDALTALPVTAALLTRRVAWERRAGRLVALVILASALYAATEATIRLRQPADPRQLCALALAGAIGMLGNWIAAEIRTRLGRRISSPALIADGEHARADALLSIGVLLSAGATWLGAPALDAIIGLAFAAWTAWIAAHTWTSLHPDDHDPS